MVDLMFEFYEINICHLNVTFTHIVKLVVTKDLIVVRVVLLSFEFESIHCV